jgi:steroid delta-isomerase-like uncharacterized protein
VTVIVEDTVDRYFEAWNHHDPPSVVRALIDGGTYTDPTIVGAPLSGDALAAHVQDLLDGFPDLSFEIVQVAAPTDSVVLARWLMRGTNLGSFRGAPPSGREVSLEGIDAITLTDGGLASVEGYFDRQTMAEQLGLQVLVQPFEAGPFQFGYSVRTAAQSQAKPGTITVTWIDVGSPSDAEEVRAISRPLAAELREIPGFISWVGVGIQNRLYTITAWEDEESARRIMAMPRHQEAVKRFFNGDLAVAAHTGVWNVSRLNAVWARCSSCQTMVDLTLGTGCQCGQVVESVPDYM